MFASLFDFLGVLKCGFLVIVITVGDGVRVMIGGLGESGRNGLGSLA